MSKTVKVVAISVGFYQGLREVNDVFEVPEDIVKGSKWFEPVKTEMDSAQGGDKSTNQYSRMKIDELKEIAVQLGVELTGDENKAEIIAKLTAE